MGMGLMVLIPVLLALFFWVIGRVVPPARRPAGRPAGLGGLLCVVLLILSVKAALSLFELGRQAGEAANVLAVSIDFVGPVLKSLIPATVNALAILLAFPLGFRTPPIDALYGARLRLDRGASFRRSECRHPRCSLQHVFRFLRHFILYDPGDALSALFRAFSQYLRAPWPHSAGESQGLSGGRAKTTYLERMQDVR